MSENVWILPLGSIGDGIALLTLAHNLSRQGKNVIVHHNILCQLNDKFPDFEIQARDEEHDIKPYDLIIVAAHPEEPYLTRVIEQVKKKDPDRIKVLYLYATPSKKIACEPYASDCPIDWSHTVIDNLMHFCRSKLGIDNPEKGIGCTLDNTKRKKLAVFHTTSSTPRKNWSAKKFYKLARQLEKRGYENVFLFGPMEKAFRDQALEEGFHAPKFQSLSEIFDLLQSAALFIGNDSGFGHLASAVGTPTLTIGRRKKVLNFWRPGFANGEIATPPPFLPNFKGIRWRDRYWRSWIFMPQLRRKIARLESSFIV